ncbi:hypothetical protein GTY23_32950, partial [Streptomyces sp. SID5998]|nr:hypothetical protein [Streptomyces sp. SID5998]
SGPGEGSGPGESVAPGMSPADGRRRLRRNIAADFEINDDIFGDGLPRPAGAAVPSLLRLPEGLLMEE